MKKTLETATSPRIVIAAGTLLFTTWVIMNFRLLTGEQSGFIRFFLTLAFSLAILFRPKPDAPSNSEPKGTAPFSCILSAVAGTGAVLTGIIFDIRQLEWLGLLFIIAACLRWALPPLFRKDIFFALFLIYWAHPLPGSVFGPMQLTLQQISVTASEWLLQILNVRVWADGMVLYTGLNTFEIPSWCSGMRTATTVFLLTLGLGILKRFKWYECTVLIGVALVQAVILNILRITVMVALAPATGSWGGINFLHNTSGIIVIAAVFLTYWEITWWKKKKDRKLPATEPELGKARALAGYPPFWSVVLSRKWVILTAAALAILAAGAVYKSRPFHKAEMVKDVATALRDTGALKTALKAAEEVQKLVPDDEEWNLTVVRILIISQKYAAAQEALKKTIISDGTEKDVLSAYCLMGLQKIAEAAAVVGKLPEDLREKDPRVAMILAEIAYYGRKPDEVARRVITASHWYPNITRIRALYPFLRIYRKWNAIAASDLNLPYTDPTQALSAMEAYMNLDNTPVLASLIMEALAAWPDDPRILEPLFFMGMKRGETEWENRFSRHFAKCVAAMNDPDALSPLFGKCFQLSRPDLAWFLYNRIEAVDPGNPTLSMCAATYGDSWFLFRKRFLGINSPVEEEKIDIKPVFLMTSSFHSWREAFSRVPLAEDLAVADTVKARRAFLEKALKEFDKRNRGGRLTTALQYEYARALEMKGDTERAVGIINGITSTHAGLSERNTSIISEIYERRGDWQNVYETLRESPATDNPAQSPLLRLCQAQVELKLNLAALHTAEEAVRRFPDSTLAAGTLAFVQLNLDVPEEALFTLGSAKARGDRQAAITEAEALFRTQRYNEGIRFCRSIFLPGTRIPPDAKQDDFLRSAEISLLWHWVSTPTKESFAQTAAMLRNNAPTATSPFIRKMINLWLECYSSGCGGNTADTARWLACGRDDTEKAVALNQLTLLLCHEGRFTEARNVAGKAVKFMPKSAILWQALISLSDGNIDVIAAARRSCPDNPEIWLAELVARTRDAGDLKSQISGLTSQISNLKPQTSNPDNSLSTLKSQFSRFPPAAVARAGEYFFRKGYKKAASLAAYDAASRARGLLPAYMLGLNCAIMDKDKARTAEYTTLALKASIHPSTLLYKQMIIVKSAENKIDADEDIVEALKSLRRDEPANPLWAQMLGYVRFMRGGMETVDALTQMTSALDAGATNKIPFIIAAEAARQLGNHSGAANILKKGLKLHPDSLEMHNNLVFTLALTPAMAIDGPTPQKEAVGMIPDLLTRSSTDLRVLDTVATTYIRAGDFNRAERVVALILGQAKKGSELWFRAKYHTACMAAKNGKAAEAESILREILRSSREVSDEDIINANKLLMEVQPAKPANTQPASPTPKKQ